MLGSISRRRSSDSYALPPLERGGMDLVLWFCLRHHDSRWIPGWPGEVSILSRGAASELWTEICAGAPQEALHMGLAILHVRSRPFSWSFVVAGVTQANQPDRGQPRPALGFAQTVMTISTITSLADRHFSGRGASSAGR